MRCGISCTRIGEVGHANWIPSPLDSDAAAAGITTIVVRVTDDGVPASYIEQSFTVSVASVTSIKNESIASKGITVSPNPCSGAFNIQVEDPITNAAVSVESASGTIVYSSNFPILETIELNLSGKTPGVYFVRINSEKGQIIKKIIVW